MTPTRSLFPRWIAPTALSLACLCLLLGAGAAVAAEAIVYTHESVPAYEKQLAANEIQEATFNKKVRNLHLTLKNGTHVLVKYPPKDEPTLDSALKSKGITVTFLSPAAAKAEAASKPVHHKIRYIVGGVVIVIIVIVGGVLLYNRRRRALEE